MADVNNGESLADYVRLAMERLGVTTGRALDEATAKRGDRITYTFANAVLAGTYRSRPQRKTLDAVARFAGVQPERVYEAARLPLPGPRFADELPPEVDYLNPHQREAVVHVIRAFLETERGSGSVDVDADPHRTDDPLRSGTALRSGDDGDTNEYGSGTTRRTSPTPEDEEPDKEARTGHRGVDRQPVADVHSLPIPDRPDSGDEEDLIAASGPYDSDVVRQTLASIDDEVVWRPGGQRKRKKPPASEE